MTGVTAATGARTGHRESMDGHYAGPATRLAAFALDSVIVTFAFSLVAAVVSYAVDLVTSVRFDASDDSLGGAIGALTFVLLYHVGSLVVAGRTPGKAVIGLRVVQRSGAPLRVGQAVRRVVTFPLTFATLGLGFVGLFVGTERRALHDVLGGTVVVYDWGTRVAELPTALSEYLVRAGADIAPSDDTAAWVPPPTGD